MLWGQGGISKDCAMSFYCIFLGLFLPLLLQLLTHKIKKKKKFQFFEHQKKTINWIYATSYLLFAIMYVEFFAINQRTFLDLLQGSKDYRQKKLENYFLLLTKFIIEMNVYTFLISLRAEISWFDEVKIKFMKSRMEPQQQGALWMIYSCKVMQHCHWSFNYVKKI